MMIHAAAVFLAGFFQVGGQALQTQNIMARRHGVIFLTSGMITSAWALGILGVIQNPVTNIPAFMLGCACGAEVATYFGHRIRRKDG